MTKNYTGMLPSVNALLFLSSKRFLLKFFAPAKCFKICYILYIMKTQSCLFCFSFIHSENEKQKKPIWFFVFIKHSKIWSILPRQKTLAKTSLFLRRGMIMHTLFLYLPKYVFKFMNKSYNYLYKKNIAICHIVMPYK